MAKSWWNLTWICWKSLKLTEIWISNWTGDFCAAIKFSKKFKVLLGFDVARLGSLNQRQLENFFQTQKFEIYKQNFHFFPKNGSIVTLTKENLNFKLDFRCWKVLCRGLKVWHSQSTLKRAFQRCRNHPDRTKIARFRFPAKSSGLSDQVETSQNAGTARKSWKMEISAISNCWRSAMSRNDPTHSLKWNAKENPGFFQPNQLDLGPKNDTKRTFWN